MEGWSLSCTAGDMSLLPSHHHGIRPLWLAGVTAWGTGGATGSSAGFWGLQLISCGSHGTAGDLGWACIDTCMGGWVIRTWDLIPSRPGVCGDTGALCNSLLGHCLGRENEDKWACMGMHALSIQGVVAGCNWPTIMLAFAVGLMPQASVS